MKSADGNLRAWPGGLEMLGAGVESRPGTGLESCPGESSIAASASDGFTLVELMVVMLIIGVLTAIAIPNYISAMKGAREAVLKEDLHVMRNAIDAYTVDKERAPQSLDDLVSAGYLKSIPQDPMTRSATTWVPVQSDAVHTLDQTDPGIDDVHSGSSGTGSDGQPYSNL